MAEAGELSIGYAVLYVRARRLKIHWVPDIHGGIMLLRQGVSRLNDICIWKRTSHE